MRPSPLPSPVSPRFEGVQATLTSTLLPAAFLILGRYLLGGYCVPGSGLGKTDFLILWKSQPKASKDIRGFYVVSCITSDA